MVLSALLLQEVVVGRFGLCWKYDLDALVVGATEPKEGSPFGAVPCRIVGSCLLLRIGGLVVDGSFETGDEFTSGVVDDVVVDGSIGGVVADVFGSSAAAGVVRGQDQVCPKDMDSLDLVRLRSSRHRLQDFSIAHAVEKVCRLV